MRKLIELFFCHSERGIRRGNPRIDGYMEEYLRDFVWIDTGIAAGTQVQGQFLAAKRRQNGNCDQASRASIQVRASPEEAPGRLGYEALEVGIKFSCASLCLLDVLTSEHFFAHLHSIVET